MCGVKMALCLPFKRIAICVARRPRTLFEASTTYQSPRTVSFFANTVDTVDITKTPTPEGPAPSDEAPKNGGLVAFREAGPWKKGRKCTQAPEALQNAISLRDLGPYNPR